MYQNFSLSKQRSHILQIPLRIHNNDKCERRQCPDQPLRISEPMQSCPRSPELAASSELALGPVKTEAESWHHGGALQGPPQTWRPRVPASPPGLLTALLNTSSDRALTASKSSPFHCLTGQNQTPLFFVEPHPSVNSTRWP